MKLLADIGGTRARLALCEPGGTELLELRKYTNRDYGSLLEVIQAYLSDAGGKPTQSCIAVAGPVLGDEVALTNLPWKFSLQQLQQDLGLERLKVVNDFTALAMSLPHIPADMREQVGGGEPLEHQPIAVLGPGTGMGVSGVLWSGSHWVPIAGEGGNIQFAPSDDLEETLMHMARQRVGFVAVEEFLSGRGIVFLYRMLGEIRGHNAEKLEPHEITQKAADEECPLCVETVQRFSAILGSAAGDLALTLGARGGVYIGGGIAPLLGKVFLQSNFRERFIGKGRFETYLDAIPTYILHSHARAALMGASVLLDDVA